MTICGYYYGFGDRWLIDSCPKHFPGIYSGKDCYDIAVGLIDVGSGGNIPPYSCIRLVSRSLLEDPRVRYHCGLYSAK